MAQFGNAVGRCKQNVIKIALGAGGQIAVPGKRNQRRKIDQIPAYITRVYRQFLSVLPAGIVPSNAGLLSASSLDELARAYTRVALVVKLGFDPPGGTRSADQAYLIDLAVGGIAVGTAAWVVDADQPVGGAVVNTGGRNRSSGFGVGAVHVHFDIGAGLADHPGNVTPAGGY